MTTCSQRPRRGHPGRPARTWGRRRLPAARGPDAAAVAGGGPRPGGRAASGQPAAPAGRGVRRGGRAAVGDHLGTARHRQDHPGPPRRHGRRPPVRRAVRRHRGRQGRARGHGPRGPRARPVRPPDRAVPRRDPPVHQGPAGRPAARRGEPAGRSSSRPPPRTRRSASSRRCCRARCWSRWPRSTTTRSPTWSTPRVDRRARAGRRASRWTRRRAHLVRIAGGDARRALTALEAAAGVALDAAPRRPHRRAPVPITLAQAEQAVAHAAVRYDRAGDQHYDVASALIKSMRGSDVDAALHYLARMLEAGEDPRFIARRIVIAASEDVGMADPTALQTAVAAMHAVAQIGMPEARIILAQAVVHNAMAPKSNAAYLGINAAIADVRAGKGGPVPPHLRGSGYAGADAPRARRGVPLRPRRPGRGRRAAVPPGRPGRRRLLPAHRPRLRGTARTTLEVAARPDPRSVTICHIRVPECWNPPVACGTFTPSRGEGVTSPQQGAVITMLRGRPVPGHTPSGRRAHVARFREHGYGGGSRGRPPRASRAGGRRQASRPFAVPDRLRPTAPRQGRDRVLRASWCSSCWWPSSRRCCASWRARPPRPSTRT